MEINNDVGIGGLMHLIDSLHEASHPITTVPIKLILSYNWLNKEVKWSCHMQIIDQ